MTAIFFPLAGGIGLFLLGMVLLSDGLKAFAGDSLRQALVRFTGKPLKAFLSGALVTAMVQSSSATTVTMIGFVSAGLLTFPQALGVVLGAALGTTSTGWLVSVLGLKISIGQYAMPLVGVGAFLKLLGRGRWRPLGMAVAGFGLIFVGIESLQTAMTGLASVFDLSALPPRGWLGSLLAVIAGVAMTVVLQSSSAAVATTLTALHTGSITFEQAALLVIGASIGTTVTGAIAAIGASVPAQRTALALVLFNSATGALAMLLLPVLIAVVRWAGEQAAFDAGAVSLAAFHTLFTSVGVLLFLPSVDRFARRVERLLPDRGPVLTAHLDKSLLHVPPVALEATRRSLDDIAAELFEVVADSFGGRPAGPRDDLRRVEIGQALDQVQEFLAKIPPITDDHENSELRVQLLHGLDHLVRLYEKSRPPANVRRVLGHSRLQPVVARCREVLDRAARGLQGEASGDWLAEVERVAKEFKAANRRERPMLLQQTASGEWLPLDALDVLDAMRWLNSITNHVWRIGYHLSSEGVSEEEARAS